jgi:putative hemolysin
LIAYCTDKGGLALMNHRGEARQVKGAKRCLLPAWSTKGGRLSWVQQAGSGSYAIRVVEIK